MDDGKAPPSIALAEPQTFPPLLGGLLGHWGRDAVLPLRTAVVLTVRASVGLSSIYAGIAIHADQLFSIFASPAGPEGLH